MIYLIGGTARTGKTTIARRFLAHKGIPFFSLDYLMMGVANGLPELRVDPSSDEFIVGQQLWPILDPMLTAFIENKFDYLIEGVQLVPRYVHQLSQRFDGQVVACFLGYSEIDTEIKALELKQYGGAPDDWTLGYDEKQLVKEAERLKNLSIRIKNECDKYQLQYFDSSFDFSGTVEAVLNYLKN